MKDDALVLGHYRSNKWKIHMLARILSTGIVNGEFHLLQAMNLSIANP
jgi:hypothetical protein